ncbi:unnamed protein product, partial [Ectocarpus sp. 12 AP-2014]
RGQGPLGHGFRHGGGVHGGAQGAGDPAAARRLRIVIPPRGGLDRRRRLQHPSGRHSAGPVHRAGRGHRHLPRGRNGVGQVG